MKFRLFFYCVTAVALVLFLVATSHATERRDLELSPEQAIASGHTSDTRPAQHSTHPKKTSRPTKGAQAQAAHRNPDRGAGTTSKGK